MFNEFEREPLQVVISIVIIAIILGMTVDLICREKEDKKIMSECDHIVGMYNDEIVKTSDIEKGVYSKDDLMRKKYGSFWKFKFCPECGEKIVF